MTSTPTESLTESQINLLLDARDLDDPVVLSADDVGRAKAVLGAALREKGVRDAESLPLGALARQFEAPDQGEPEEPEIDVSALTELEQTPETGGAPEAGDALEKDFGDATDLESAVARADADSLSAARETLRKADLMAPRTPEYAGDLRRESARLLAVDADVLEDAIEQDGLPEDLV